MFTDTKMSIFSYVTISLVIFLIYPTLQIDVDINKNAKSDSYDEFNFNNMPSITHQFKFEVTI